MSHSTETMCACGSAGCALHTRAKPESIFCFVATPLLYDGFAVVRLDIGACSGVRAQTLDVDRLSRILVEAVFPFDYALHSGDDFFVA